MNTKTSAWRVSSLLSTLCLVCGLYLFAGDLWAEDATNDALAEIIETQLSQSGTNRAELQKALDQAANDPTLLPYVRFLIAFMPEQDRQALPSEFIVQNARLAELVREKNSWQKQIPEAIFFNDVLPYAVVDEPRDPWREEFHRRFSPLVENVGSIHEAVQILNQKVFEELKVKYSTARKRANQSPKESIEQGLASCSGLSIILVDACRAVGIPARFAGIAEWPNKSGNHAWVEVWDQGWHFTGAAEFDPRGLNHAWFNADAALAQESFWDQSILATSFRSTGHSFPLVWDRADKSVPAVNVTRRYTRNAADNSPEKKPTSDLFVRVWNSDRTERIAVPVSVWPSEAPDLIQTGTSLDSAHDLNDMLRFSIDPTMGHVIQIGKREANSPTRTPCVSLPPATVRSRTIDLQLPPELPQRLESSLKEEVSEQLRAWFEARFRAGLQADDSNMPPQPDLGLWQESPSAIREIAWKAFLASPMVAAWKEDFDANRVSFQEHQSPFVVRKIGERPANGWPLVIAMHGGGNAPAEVNDSQWKIMQSYYADVPECGGYKYLALRAPNNTWNGFYDNYVYPLIENLIVAQVAWGEVDSNRVYLIGYSHGGYGAFAIGPKLADRFAAVHSSAAAPTDGETSPVNLRNTRFTFMIGEDDNDYGRRERCVAFHESVREIQAENSISYPVEMFLKSGFGHRGLPDKKMIKCMYPFHRVVHPQHVSWQPTDGVIKNLYWLSVDLAAKGQRIDAAWRGNQLTIHSTGIDSLTISLDDRLGLSPGPLEILWNEVAQDATWQPSLENLANSLMIRRDPDLAYLGRIQLQAPPLQQK
jgi:predicted esterase